MSDETLNALATKAGLQTDWIDAEGEPRTVSPETLRKVLDALGLRAGSAREIGESTAKLDEQKREPPPLVTAWAGETFMAGGQVLTAPESPGYHPIQIGGVETMLAVAPPRCFEIADLSERRLAGLGVQLYALRGGHSAGFGDFAALAEFSREAAKHGIDAIGVSPTHALFPADHSHISPYSPSSRLFLNPLYADLALVGGESAQDDGAAGLIDWPKAAAEKFAALKRSYQALLDAGTGMSLTPSALTAANACCATPFSKLWTRISARNIFRAGATGRRPIATRRAPRLPNLRANIGMTSITTASSNSWRRKARAPRKRARAKRGWRSG